MIGFIGHPGFDQTVGMYSEAPETLINLLKRTLLVFKGETGTNVFSIVSNEEYDYDVEIKEILSFLDSNEKLTIKIKEFVEKFKIKELYVNLIGQIIYQIYYEYMETDEEKGAQFKDKVLEIDPTYDF